jgi:dihydropteroate synthase
MGVVNVTPDSFSDGGRWLRPASAVEHGLRLVAEGADIIDVGGESTRPGARRTSFEDEMRRVIPVVRALSGAGAFVSVDTMRAAVADLAIRAGAHMVNDVSGGQADSGMFQVVAESRVPYVVMHWRGHSDVMQTRANYIDVVSDVSAELRGRLDAAQAAGVQQQQLIIDPGLGFAKTPAQSWKLLADLPRLRRLGFPVLVGASRKSFLGELQTSTDPNGQRDAAWRDDATAAVTALASAAGAWCVRVHSVKASAEAVRVTTCLADACATDPFPGTRRVHDSSAATAATKGDATILEGR